MKEGLLALSVGVRRCVLAGLMGEEVDEFVGAKGKWNQEAEPAMPLLEAVEGAVALAESAHVALLSLSLTKAIP